MAEKRQVLNPDIKLNTRYVTEKWLRYYFYHYHVFNNGKPEPVSEQVLNICCSFMKPICFPVNNQFITYLHQVELAEYDKKEQADSSKGTSNDSKASANTLKQAIAQATVAIFGLTKAQLKRFNVRYRKLKVLVGQDSGNQKLTYMSETSEDQIPFMRTYWGRFDFKNIFYFRTGEFQFNKKIPPTIAILVGQLGDGRYFIFRNFTPDFLDAWCLSSLVYRLWVADTLDDCLAKFSERDRERILNNELNGYPLTHDESWQEFNKLVKSDRLKWAREDAEVWVSPDKFAPKNMEACWNLYKKSWFWNKPDSHKYLRRVTDQAWMKELVEECEKNPIQWSVDRDANVRVPKNYTEILKLVKNSSKHQPQRLRADQVCDKGKWIFA